MQHQLHQQGFGPQAVPLFGQLAHPRLGIVDRWLRPLHGADHQHQALFTARQREGTTVKALPFGIDDGERQLGLAAEGAIVAQQNAAAALGIVPQHDPLAQIERVDQLRVALEQQPVVIFQHLGPLTGAGTGEAIGAHRLVEQLGIDRWQRLERVALKQAEDPAQRLAIEQAAQHELAAIEGFPVTSLGVEEAGHGFCAIALLPG